MLNHKFFRIPEGYCDQGEQCIFQHILNNLRKFRVVRPAKGV